MGVPWRTGLPSRRCFGIHWACRFRHTAIIKRKKDQLGRGRRLAREIRPRKSSKPTAGRRDRQPDGKAARRTRSRGTSCQRGVDGTAGGRELSTTRTSSTPSTATIVKLRLAEPQWVRRWGGCWANCWPRTAREALIQLLADRAFEWALERRARPSSGWCCATRPVGPRPFVETNCGRHLPQRWTSPTKVPVIRKHELRQSANRFLFEFASDADRSRHHRQG